MNTEPVNGETPGVGGVGRLLSLTDGVRASRTRVSPSSFGVSSEVGSEMDAYALDNNSKYAGDHHRALSALLDEFSVTRAKGLVDFAGLRVLEVGAGGGGFAVEVADEVGPHGMVFATDVNPLAIPNHPLVQVVVHNIVTDELWGPLAGPFYFIHARLVLGHLRQRRQILTKLVAALAPGGTILIEDWDASRTAEMVMHAPSSGAAEAYTLFQTVLGEKVFAAAGTDRTWARRIHGVMVDEGLRDVRTEMHARAWGGGGPGCRLVQGTLAQVRDRLIADGGLSAEFLDRVRELLDDPQLVLAGHLLYSTSGTKPSTQ